MYLMVPEQSLFHMQEPHTDSSTNRVAVGERWLVVVVDLRWPGPMQTKPADYDFGKQAARRLLISDYLRPGCAV